MTEYWTFQNKYVLKTKEFKLNAQQNYKIQVHVRKLLKKFI